MVVTRLLLSPFVGMPDKDRAAPAARVLPAAARREHIVVVMRLLLVAFINLVSIPSYQAFVLSEKLARGATFWMLTGAESLLITALGLQVSWLLGRLATALQCCFEPAHHSAGAAGRTVCETAPRDAVVFEPKCTSPALGLQV